jgi:hypothetical protein
MSLTQGKETNIQNRFRHDAELGREDHGSISRNCDWEEAETT